MSQEPPQEVSLKAISFGAGVQSTTLLLMSLSGEIDRADCAIFEADPDFASSFAAANLETVKESELRS